MLDLAPSLIHSKHGAGISNALQRQIAIRQLSGNLSLMPRAIEEFLRLYAPYRGFARTANRDVDFHGRAIKAGEPIALLYASANRDEKVFPAADQFILDRPNLNDHLAFGMGPHVCLGIPLARLEMRVAIEELLKCTRQFEISGPVLQTRFPEVGALSVQLRFV